MSRWAPSALLALGVALLVTAAVALASTGALTPKGCIADPATNPDNCGQTAVGLVGIDSVDVSPNGKSVYAAGFFDNAIVQFSRKPTTGALTPVGCVADYQKNPAGCGQLAKGLEGANWLEVSDDGKSVYVASGGSNAIVRFDRNPYTGALTPKGCIADVGNNPAHCGETTKGLQGATSLDLSSDGKSVYVASCCADNAIARFARNPANGALTPKGCVAEVNKNPDGCAQTAPGIKSVDSVAVSDDGKSVYATGISVNAVALFSRNTATGALTSKGCIADPANNPDGCLGRALGLDGAHSVDVSGDGKSVYVGAITDHAIVRFDRDTSTGALTDKGCVATPAANPDGCPMTAKGVNGNSVTVSPDGASVYATGGEVSNAIARFDRDALTGALTKKGCFADPANNFDGCLQAAIGLDGAEAAVVSDDGKSVYVTGPDDFALVRFDRAK